MSDGILNLGILAHVDAGKTTLTERLLQTAGVIDSVGSVDAGTTQTDSLALERQRGITIRAAVAAFTVDDVRVNLIDTPGHPDFIAEVERSLAVLDGAVLVVSAVEGVQAQTVVLMRALRRLCVPTVIFVNKIDRVGADPDRVLAAIRSRLSPHVIAMGETRDAGRRDASFVPFATDRHEFVDALVNVLVEQDEQLLTAVVDDDLRYGCPDDLRIRLAAQTKAAQVHPVFFGSAVTSAGIAALMHQLPILLPAAGGDPRGPTWGSVFKVERESTGEKIAYVRLRSGTLGVRERLAIGGDRTAVVTKVLVFEGGGVVERPTVTAGQIAKLSGLRVVRVGDVIGNAPRPAGSAAFAPPTLQTAVLARNPAQKGALHSALIQLAEQDPLINVRQDDARRGLFVSLYGEVQKEVLEHTLAADFGIGIDFRETSVICTERVTGTGQALIRLGDPANPYQATMGLRIEPAPVGSGVVFRRAVEVGTIPLYVYKTVEAFDAAMTDYLRAALRRGVHGWEIADCSVALIESGYTSPGTTAADLRKLTPFVVRAALAEAGTIVCEPIQRFRLDGPADTLSAVLGLLARHRGLPQPPSVSGAWFSVDGDIPAAEVHRVQRQLHAATHGEGVLEVHFDRYEPRGR